jgi:hypothetical protein
MAHLLDFPIEILDLVTQYLVTPELGFKDNGIFNLRLTCRALCLKTQYKFGRAAFGILRVDLHPKTLERLLTICRRPAFGTAVKKLVFAHWGDEYVSFPQVPDNGLIHLDDQVSFVLSQIFEESFSNTPNLEEIVIITPCIARFRRHGFTLQSGFATVRSANDSEMRIEEFNVTSEVLYVLLTGAIAVTDTHLSTLEITKTLTPHEKHYIPVMCVSDHAVGTVSRGLQYMEHFKVTIQATDASIYSNSFGDALSTMSRLTRLDLRFVDRTATNYRDGHRPEYADRTAAAMQSLRNVRFPRLTSLVIRNAAIDPSVLKGFLQLHQDILHCLGLLGIYLQRGGKWYEILALLLDDMQGLNELRTNNLFHRGVLHPPWLFGARSGHLVGRDAVVRGLHDMLGRVYEA